MSAWIKTAILHEVRTRRSTSAEKVSFPPESLEIRIQPSAHPLGTEFLVNVTTSGDQRFSADSPQSLAMDSQGNYVVTWYSSAQDGSGTGVYARQFMNDGTPLGGEFQVNVTTTSDQIYPNVAMDADGEYVITWTSSGGQDGDGDGIYARRFAANGSPLTGEVRVNTTTTNHQSFSTIAMDSQGNYVISWQSAGQDGSGTGIYAQRYSDSGTPIGSEYRVNSYTTNNQLYPVASMDSTGDFLITWWSLGQDGDDYGIYAQRYDSAGGAQGTEFVVSSVTAFDQRYARSAYLSDGSFIITWSDGNRDGHGFGVFARKYAANGTPIGGDFQVNTTTTNNQWRSSISADNAGNFVIVWISDGNDGNLNDIYAQCYSSSLAKLGPEFRINTTTIGNQSYPSVQMDDQGAFIAVWSDDHLDGDSWGVIGQRFSDITPEEFIGVKRNANFYLDSNHSGAWDGPLVDSLNSFGSSTDKPLIGDWDGDGYTDIGVWRNGTFYLDLNGNGIWNGPAIDKQFVFGNSTDTPIAGDWNNDGKDEIGVWRAGKFYLDMNGNGMWNSGVDAVVAFGAVTDTPVIGDWNGDGVDDLGVWRAGRFYLDLNGNQSWNSGVDGVFTFGNPTDTPLVGDFNGDGMDDLGVWRAGKFYLDSNGNRSWNAGSDTIVAFGSMTDTPFIGYWRPKAIPGPFPTSSVTSVSPILAGSSGSDEVKTIVSGDALASLIAPIRKPKH